VVAEDAQRAKGPIDLIRQAAATTHTHTPHTTRPPFPRAAGRACDPATHLVCRDCSRRLITPVRSSRPTDAKSGGGGGAAVAIVALLHVARVCA
jgi:hypothetical protein